MRSAMRAASQEPRKGPTQCCALVKISGGHQCPRPEFQRDICKFWGTHQIHLIFTCKIEYSFPEISVHFYFNLSLM